jgi:hypothetical protein
MPGAWRRRAFRAATSSSELSAAHQGDRRAPSRICRARACGGDRAASGAGGAPRIAQSREPPQRVAPINPVMHQEPSDEGINLRSPVPIETEETQERGARVPSGLRTYCPRVSQTCSTVLRTPAFEYSIFGKRCGHEQVRCTAVRTGLIERGRGSWRRVGRSVASDDRRLATTAGHASARSHPSGARRSWGRKRPL